MEYTLTISGKHYKVLKNHLYPGDGKEAVAIALCGRHTSKHKKRLLVYEVFLIPYTQCSIREPDLVNWSTETLVPALEKASRRNLSVLKIHSHPTGYRSFSHTDNLSDRELFSSVFGWMDNEEPHASAVMLPDGEIFGRVFHADLTHQSLSQVTVAGDDIHFWFTGENFVPREFEKRTMQAFGRGTTEKLNKLTIGVVGCSGTGSIVIDQLVRLGVGNLILIDPDVVEEKNLNRIVNSTMNDAKKMSFKVDVIESAINKIGLGTDVETFNKNIYTSTKAMIRLADCDIIFGCVDSIDGRHFLNQVSTFYLIPYFDLGIKIISDLKGGVDQIQGTVHYIQPGGSSLRTRGVYTDEELRAAAMLRENPEEYVTQKKNGYVVNINVESPAVISINSQIASMAVNELLARIHKFRYDSNSEFDINRVSFTDGYFQHEHDESEDVYLSKFVGRGDITPMLNMPELNLRDEDFRMDNN